VTTVMKISEAGVQRGRESHGLKRRGIKSDDCLDGDWQAEDPKVTTVTRSGKPEGKPDDCHQVWQPGGLVV